MLTPLNPDAVEADFVDAEPVIPTRWAPPAPTPQPPSVPFVADMDFATRNSVLKSMASAAGLRLPDTRVPEGESLISIGEESKRALQADVKDLPYLHDGLNAYRATLRAENARDTAAPLQVLRMDPRNGGLLSPGSSVGVGYTHAGFQQVTQFLKPPTIRNGFAENMLALPPALRSQVFDHHAVNSRRVEDTVVRAVTLGGRRIIRAVTSKKHSLESGDDLTIADVCANLPSGAKVRITRSPGGDRSDVEILWPAMERQLVVGDVAMIAIRISNSETKGGSLKIEPTLLRVLCYNFTTAWAEGLEEELSLRHVGDLSRKLPRMLKRASEAVEPFVHAFGDAYRNPFPGTLQTRGEVLERVGKVYALPEATLTLAGASWDMDGAKSAGNTLAGLAHALTRASQAQGMSDASATERVAGRIIGQGWAALA